MILVTDFMLFYEVLVIKFLLGQLFLILSLLLTSCGEESFSHLMEAPDSRNNPVDLGVQIKNIDDVKMKASLSNKGWSGYYWPTYQGSVGYRWQEGNQSNSYRSYMYEIPTIEDVKKMSTEKIDRLSPLEKYDILHPEKEFFFSKLERRHVLAAVDEEEDYIPTWYGLCHGWAPAAAMEPTPGYISTQKSPLGFDVKFYSSDIKALMTLVYAGAQVENYFVGGRCESEEIELDEDRRPTDSRCRDINPATLHLVLDDYIATNDKGFVADITASAEVWNQPIIGYEMQYSNRRPLSSDPEYKHYAKGTTELVDVDLRMDFLVESNPTKKVVRPLINAMNMDYTLELDKNGNIIGGEWNSNYHPDFLWRLASRPTGQSSSYVVYEDIKKILTDSEGTVAPDNDDDNHDMPRPPEVDAVTIEFYNTSVVNTTSGRRLRAFGTLLGDEVASFKVMSVDISGDSVVLYGEDASDGEEIDVEVALKESTVAVVFILYDLNERKLAEIPISI